MFLTRYEPSLGGYLMYHKTDLYFFTLKEMEEYKNKGVVVVNTTNPNGAMSAPMQVQLAMTSSCNIKCFNCYDAHGGQTQDHMTRLSVKQKKQLIDYLVDWGVLFLQLSGGEPFLAKDIREIAEYAKSKKLTLSLLTNGIPLSNRENAFWAAEIFNVVQISFNAVKRFKEWTGVDTLNKLIEGIRNASQCCIASGASFNVTTTINEISISEFESIAGIVNEINPTHWRIGEEVPLGRAVSKSNHMDLLEKSYKIFLKLKQKYGKKNWHHCFDVVTADDILPIEWQSSPAGRVMLYVSADGSVYPFPYLKMPEFYLGRYPDDDLREIWNNAEPLNKLRGVDYSNTGCGGCKNVCVRWSREINFHFNKNIFEPPTPFTNCPKKRR